MTITPAQMRAAGLELRLRRQGVAQPRDATASTRPFGGASESTLRRIAAGPTTEDVAGMKTELERRDAGDIRRGTGTARPFEQVQTRTLREYVKRRD